MWIPYALGGLVLGFLLIFWVSPLGVPPLRRMGEGQLPPDLRMGSRTDDTLQLLETYGERGLAHWRRLLWLDMLFPAVYGCFLAELIADWAQWSHASEVWVNVAASGALSAVLADYAENVLLLRVIAAHPRPLRWALGLAAGFTRVKFLAFGLTFLTPLLHALFGGLRPFLLGGA